MTVSEFVSEETKRRIGFMMKFTKMQAFGNDYVYIDAIHQELKNLPELARFVSDRHFAIGSDGMVLICPSDKGDFRIAVLSLSRNSDRSFSSIWDNI